MLELVFQIQNLILLAVSHTFPHLTTAQALDPKPELETIVENQDKNISEIPKLDEKKRNIISNILRNPTTNLFLASGDIMSAGTDFIKIPIPLKRFIDKYSVVLTKMVMGGRYLEAAVEAFKQNRMVESIGRLMGVVALPLVKLNDLAFASGLGEFMSQLDLALEGKVAQKKALISLDRPETKLENSKAWFSSLSEAYKEIFSSGFGENRKIFPKGKDEGHTLVTAGSITFFSSLLGMLFGSKSRNSTNKLFGLTRTVGSLTADYTLLNHPDKRMRQTGKMTTVVSITDLIQRFLPEKALNTINHVNLLLNTFANQMLTDRSHFKSKNEVTVYGQGEAALTA